MDPDERPTARARRNEIVDREQPFRIDELFFSTTDRRGLIQSCNEVFVRTAGFSIDELIGHPHNVIRHPHMPMVVFRMLWETIEAGEAMAAYVKNRAKDGSYYWVLATVRPIDGGYLSVRLKPSSPWFGAVEQIYAELLGIEQGIGREGGSRTQAMDAAAARLDEWLVDAGFANYTEFVQVALVAEVVARRAAIGGTTCDGDIGDTGNTRDADPYRRACAATRRLAHRLEAELEHLESYARLNQELSERSSALVGLADEGKVLAINAVLAAGRLGQDGFVLAKVAELMKQTFPVVAEQSRLAVASVERTRAHLAKVGFAVALATLQNDTAGAFVRELIGAGESGEIAPGSLASAEMLARCLRDDIDQMQATLGGIGEGLAEISRATARLENNLDLLGAIERSGRIEATRANRSGSFETLFESTKARLASARGEMASMIELANASATRASSSAGDHVDELDVLDEALSSARLVAV